ncbi:hypothetical protein [Acidovorax lacteus]|uniref:Uncharacterized protein n=1 Tax=Acidovorax lacteus TaxID=1924988 RepID=A0ABP8L365_9BURK
MLNRLFRSLSPRGRTAGLASSLHALLDRVAYQLRHWLAQRLPRPLQGLRRSPVLVPVRYDGATRERKVERRRALY